MRWTAIVMLTACLLVSSKGFSQAISLSVDKMPVKKVILQLQEQTGYYFLCDQDLIEENEPVSLHVKNSAIDKVLKLCFPNKEFTYTIIDKTILVKKKGTTTHSERDSTGSLRGVVGDSSGLPLPGVTLTVSGKKSGAITNSDGQYMLSGIMPDDIITFTFVGMKPEVIRVGNRSELNVTMKVNVVSIEQFVAVGYGAQKKDAITGSISTIQMDDMVRVPASNLSGNFSGMLAGMYVRTGTGMPGTGSTLRVRSSASWNASDPLIVIDGIIRDQTSFDALDPIEIDQVSVLKDAASAAIYGSRSANGVILVTTRKGSPFKMSIDFSAVSGWQRVGSLPAYMDVYKALKTTQAVVGGISDEEIAWALKANPRGEAAYDAVYQHPADQKYSFGVSGGNEKFTCFFGGSFYNENGFLPKVWYKRYNLRANVSYKPNKDFTVGLNLGHNNGTKNRFNFMDDNSADLNAFWGKLLYFDIFSIPYMNGKPVNPGWLGNLPEMIKNGGYMQHNNQQMDALITVDYHIPVIQGLSLRASYSRNGNNAFDKNYAKKQTIYNFKRTGPNNLIITDEIVGIQKSGDPAQEYIGNSYAKTDAYQFNTQISYDRHFGKHYVNVTAVYEQYEFQSSAFSMARNTFPLFAVDQFFGASNKPDDWQTGGNEKQDARLSYIGRFNYEYGGKYFFSASVRRDGSIKFAPDQRWGWFPSVSGGWLMSEERWYRSSILSKVINRLKLKGAFGTIGDDGIGGWKWLDQYNIESGTYYLGAPGIAQPRLSYGGLPATALTWEKSRIYNLGVELMIGGRLSLVIEYWRKHTYDILGERLLVLPAEFGSMLPASNYGVGNAKGIDMELGYYSNPSQVLSYSVKGTFGLATTRTILKDHATNAQLYDNPEGKTSTYGTGYLATGILRSPDDVKKLSPGYTIWGAVPEPGMMNFADLSGPNGVPDGKIDAYDKTIIGKYMGPAAAPVSFGLSGSLTYKGFTLAYLFSGLAGFKITYNDPWGRNFGGSGKIPRYHDDAWSETNTKGSTPKLFAWGDPRARGYVEASTFNTYPGDFIRLKYVNLEYALPVSLFRRTGITRIQVFASATNLFYWSAFRFYDPELSAFTSYPIMQNFMIGVNVSI
ncbi:SusC/RagA family TonB-linked outer membrane protein [Chitinophaga eiseniae]|uniref:SusC/RagA family TonB-linked outer membrane protein n=1 Tax=Chitinophaga eiseniae TaxID=634771 RepID=A0A847SRG9_9BACT|nr:SusC/RagA family TonB-linked outer membrane protein [Chitinophaga eiseniae]NLR82964.1 SusC/RagA family TonB-linked outer membrane protein [Chitinophaga eiseniae]